MTYKVPMYYVVKVSDEWDGEEYIKSVSYKAGPFSAWEDANDYRKIIEMNTILNNNCYLQIATQYIEVEL